MSIPSQKSRRCTLPPETFINHDESPLYILSSLFLLSSFSLSLSHTHTLSLSLSTYPSSLPFFTLNFSLHTHTHTPTMHSSALFFFFLAILTFTTAQQPEETPLACYQPSCTPLISLLQDCKISIDPSTGNINFPVEANTTGTTDKCLCTQKIVNAYGKPFFFCRLFLVLSGGRRERKEGWGTELLPGQFVETKNKMKESIVLISIYSFIFLDSPFTLTPYSFYLSPLFPILTTHPISRPFTTSPYQPTHHFPHQPTDHPNQRNFKNQIPATHAEQRTKRSKPDSAPRTLSTLATSISEPSQSLCPVPLVLLLVPV
ncbi:hypothetical protein BKA57DRAFT_228624 [Linnemannia elongata]|nr:hypothetical protein BKA57DRAFT_228624 [Linnemannia elongata]